MNLESLVLVDTCVWIPFLSSSNHKTKKPLEILLENGRVAMIGPVEFEILVGIHRKKDADWIASRFSKLNRPSIFERDWRSAARTGSNLMSIGFKVPMTDLLLASIAIRLDCAVFTTDPHFDLIPNLKLYRP